MNAKRVPQTSPPPPDLIVLEMTVDEAERVRRMFGNLSRHSFKNENDGAYALTSDIFRVVDDALKGKVGWR